MSHLAIILIIVSALIHAGWNLLSKRSSPSAAFFFVANGIGAWIFFPWVAAYPGIVYTMPNRTWLLLLLTGFFQAVYCTALAAAYRHGDLSISYPVARSLPVILVPFVTLLLGRGKLLGTVFMIGAALILAGGTLISMDELRRFKERPFLKSALPMAVWAALGTTGYSMVDDRALRLVRESLGGLYGTIPITCVYGFLEAITCTTWLGIFILSGTGWRRVGPVSLRWAAGTGVLIYLTYGMVLLSMAYARDISLIVAFRQVSILAGAFMGILFLKEPSPVTKIGGLAILFTGLVLVAFS